MKREEQNLQISCVRWFNYQYPKLKGTLFHVPNSAKRGIVEGAMFKRMGVVAGVPDLIFLHNSIAYAFELKSDEGSLSKSQKEIHKIWQEQGIEVKIIKDATHFTKSIKQIINAKPSQL